jgi:hypothetical protein
MTIQMPKLHQKTFAGLMSFHFILEETFFIYKFEC